MAGGEYAPKDSRDVTLHDNEPGKPSGWRKAEDGEVTKDSELAPNDQRNVTGTAKTPDGHWTDNQAKPPRGVPQDEPVSAGEAAQGAPSAADTSAERTVRRD